MILILTQCFPSRLGGVESLISNLALGLSKTEKITVFADQHNLFYDTIFDNDHKNEILIRRIGGVKFFRRKRKINTVKSFIKSEQVKLVLADTWKSLELGIDYINSKKIPTICLAHGNELLPNNKKKFERIRYTLNKVSSIVANSLFTENLLKTLINPEIKVNVIYPGALDIRGIEKTIISSITGNPILLTLSRVEKRKGHLFVIECIQKLILEFPNIQYVIAGTGPELKSLKKIVSKKKLEKNIIFVGKINDSQKNFLFKKTNLMVMPTLDETQNSSIEGFGIAYIEAAYFAIPSIASNIGGTPEAVIHNFTGKIINRIEDLYYSINHLLKNEQQIKELGLNAQKRAIKEFNWDHISNKYLLLIKSICKLD